MKTLKTKYSIKLAISLGLFVWFIYCLPSPLFNDSYCTVLESSDGQLLSATIADDGQWRFPEIKEVPKKFEDLILLFEDEYFYTHFGVNPISLAKAFVTNIKHRGIKRGGSTITMQVIRLSRKNKSRTVLEKIKEIILSIRLEFRLDKHQILEKYTSHAPFGGNVVGLEAASWRYYGRSPNQLSWGEMATLAVLPNAPSLIYPGRNHELLLKKRNRLLDKLFQAKKIDSISCELAKQEPLPSKPKKIKQAAIHLLTRAYNEEKKGKRIKTSVNYNLQERIAQVVNNHYLKMKNRDVHNAAVLVMEVETGKVKAYIGNTLSKNAGAVDLITAPRSSGSILKPFLYASMLDAGTILPQTIIPDIPTQYEHYTPQNFNKKYDGAVAADNALIRSLNIPAVKMLHQFGIKRFYSKLQQLQMSTISKGANHYGLSLILGGAETTLNDLVSCYGSMARTLNHYEKYNGKYNSNDYFKITYNSTLVKRPELLSEHTLFNASSIYWTFNVLSYLNRPREEIGWKSFSSSRKIAWKTGTSFGHRDAWAVGITPEYIVGVWVGNASGEGKAGLTGISAAAPLLFNVFDKLPQTTWFSKPIDDMSKIAVCSKSGMRSSQWCEKTDSVLVPFAGLNTPACHYHKWIHLDEDEQYQVNSSCYPVAKMIKKSWFVLPPVWEWYYKSKNPNYISLPPFKPGCEQQIKNMELIYPNNLKELYLSKNLKGEKGKLKFEVAHRNPDTQIYWHIDNQFITVTNHFHQLEISPSVGKHILTLIDQNGETITRHFEVLE